MSKVSIVETSNEPILIHYIMVLLEKVKSLKFYTISAHFKRVVA